MSSSQHIEKLQQLGLLSETEKPVAEQEELERILAVANKYESMFEQLEETVEELLQQVKDCEYTKRFLETAINAAEQEDLEECKLKTQSLIDLQSQARVRSERCVQQLKDLSKDLPETRRRRVDQFLGLSTTTVREPLSTEIELD